MKKAKNRFGACSTPFLVRLLETTGRGSIRMPERDFAALLEELDARKREELRAALAAIPVARSAEDAEEQPF